MIFILNIFKKSFKINSFIPIFALAKTVVVAQLVRASVCGTEGRGFESHQPPFFLNHFSFELF